MVGEERCHAGRGVDVVVKSELGSRQPIDPVILLVVAVGAQILLNRLVGSFRATVGLGMKSCGCIMTYAKQGPQGSQEG